MKQSEFKIMQHRRYLTLLWKKEVEGFYYPMEPPKSYFQKEKVYVELKRGGGLYTTYSDFFLESKNYTLQEEIDYRNRYDSAQALLLPTFNFDKKLMGVKLRLTNAVLHTVSKEPLVYVLENEETGEVFLFSGKHFIPTAVSFDEDGLFYGPKDPDMKIIG